MLTSYSHEFTGIVEEIGLDVKKFKKGDQIVSPFTVSWLVHFFRIPLQDVDWAKPGVLLLQERPLLAMFKMPPFRHGCAGRGTSRICTPSAECHSVETLGADLPPGTDTIG